MCIVGLAVCLWSMENVRNQQADVDVVLHHANQSVRRGIEVSTELNQVFAELTALPPNATTQWNELNAQWKELAAQQNRLDAQTALANMKMIRPMMSLQSARARMLICLRAEFACSIGFSLASAYSLWLKQRRAARRAKGLCIACGYDLRGSPDRCPECGAARPVEVTV
jgi:rubrerythrin